MLTARSNCSSLSALFVVLLSFINFNDALGQQPRCAAFDQYCLTHSDCCSNTCLTYLYRCAHNYNGIFPYTFFGEKLPAEATFDDVIELTFANTARNQLNRRVHHQQQQQPQQLFDQSQINYRKYKRATDEEATADNAIAESQKISDAAVADCKAIGLKCYTNDECCSKRCHGFLHQCVT